MAHAPSHSTMVPFGDFILRKQLGHEHIFDAWLGEQTADRQPMLIRRMLPPFVSSAPLVQAWQQRATRLSALRVPTDPAEKLAGLVLPVAIGEVEQTPFVASPLPSSWSLRFLLDLRLKASEQKLSREEAPASASPFQEPFPLPFCLKICQTIGHTLLAVHQLPESMVHGVLQPGAIWIGTDGQLLLSDLEIGAFAENVLEPSEFEHPRAWRFIAPERSEQWATPAPSVDVFSLASVLLELLVLGRLGSVQVRLDPHEMLPLLEGHGVPAALVNLLERTLLPPPEQRPALPIFLSELNALAQSLPLPLVPGTRSTPDTFQSWLSRHAPPVEVLDPLERAPDRFDADVQERLLRARRLEAAAAGKKLPTPSGKAHEGRPWGLLLFMLLVTVGALWYAGPTLQELFGPARGGLVRMEITSQPPEAAIFNEGNVELGTAPLKTALPIDASGHLRLKARLKGYLTSTLYLKELEVGGAYKAEFVLAPATNTTSSLLLTTLPGGAQVLLDGKGVGTSTDLAENALTVSDLAVGQPMTLTVKLPGYRTVTQSIELHPEEPLELHLTLDSVGKDGEEGAGPLAGTPGERSERVNNRPDSSKSTPRKSPPSPPSQAQAEAPTGPVGFLIITSVPGAQILLDGKDFGWTNDRQKRPIQIGHHRIGLKSRKGQFVERDVNVKEGEIRQLSYDFINNGWQLSDYRPF